VLSGWWWRWKKKKIYQNKSASSSKTSKKYPYERKTRLSALFCVHLPSISLSFVWNFISVLVCEKFVLLSCLLYSVFNDYKYQIMQNVHLLSIVLLSAKLFILSINVRGIRKQNFSKSQFVALSPMICVNCFIAFLDNIYTTSILMFT
jgi:hypothetical protein